MGDFESIASRFHPAVRHARLCPLSLAQKLSWAETDGSKEQFTEFYYNTFDGQRENLEALYRENSMLTFETSAVQGVAAIIDKLKNLPFTKVAHKLATMDAQPSNDSGGILVLVTGQLLVDEEQRPMNYTQTFQLLPDGRGSYFVFNDVFRLVYS